MKILYVLEYYYPNIGGVEKLFKNLAESLANEGNKVLVLTNQFDKKLPKNEIINGVKIKRISLYNRFLFSFFALPWVIKHCRSFDIIHTSSYNAALPAWLASKFNGKKIIITFHEVWGKLWFKLPFINGIQKVCYFLFEKLVLNFNYDKIIAVSDFTKNSLLEKGKDDSRVKRIYNGLDYPENKNQIEFDSKNFTFSYHGRLGVSKGLDILIPAAHKFISKNPKSYFKIISPDKPDKMYKKIQQLISNYDFGNNIRLLHGLNDEEKTKELLNSHCIVIPSYSEGFCFVAAEASALKIPIIHSAAGALEEIVCGESLVMNEMSVKSLYEALVEAKNSNFTYTQRKEFTLDKCILEYKKTYKELIR